MLSPLITEGQSRRVTCIDESAEGPVACSLDYGHFPSHATMLGTGLVGPVGARDQVACAVGSGQSRRCLAGRLSLFPGPRRHSLFPTRRRSLFLITWRHSLFRTSSVDTFTASRAILLRLSHCGLRREARSQLKVLSFVKCLVKITISRDFSQ